MSVCAARRVVSAILGGMWPVLAACSGPPPPASSPVIVATPSTVCVGDDYKTPITLDGTKSSANLTLIPTEADAGATPLEFRWTLSGSAYRIESGTLTASKLVVVVAGTEPLQVDLHVANGVGGTADSMLTVPVTALDGGACPLGSSG